jgi:hypothetical protein
MTVGKESLLLHYCFVSQKIKEVFDLSKIEEINRKEKA